MSDTTPVSDVDTELDNLLERVAVKSANQYGGFEGWDDEADKQDVIGESREAIKALIGTIAEQIIIGEDGPELNDFDYVVNKFRAEQRQRFKDYMENK